MWLNDRIRDRLGELLTEIHKRDPASISPSKLASIVAGRFGGTVEIAGELGYGMLS